MAPIVFEDEQALKVFVEQAIDADRRIKSRPLRERLQEAALKS